MDVEKLSEILISDKDLEDIPAIYVLRVAISVIEHINNGDCMRELETCM